MYVCAVYTDTKLRVVHYIQIGLNHLFIDPPEVILKLTWPPGGQSDMV